MDVVLYEEFARVGSLIETHLKTGASAEEIKEFKEDLKSGRLPFSGSSWPQLARFLQKNDGDGR